MRFWQAFLAHANRVGDEPAMREKCERRNAKPAGESASMPDMIVTDSLNAGSLVSSEAIRGAEGGNLLVLSVCVRSSLSCL